MTKKFLLAIVFTITYLSSWAGSIPVDKKIHELILDQWTSEDGLISNNLTSVIQSKEGFLWITSFNGLIKFDGVKFEVFDKEQIEDLHSNAFYSIYEDDEGKLWLGTQASGIITTNGKRFIKVGDDDTLSPSIRVVLKDTKGGIWAGSNNEGVFLDEGEGFKRVENPLIDGWIINDIKEGKDGSIWIATNGNGVSRIKYGVFTHYTMKDGLSSNIVNNIFIDESNVLLGTSAGITVIEESGNSVVAGTNLYEINHIVRDEFGYHWVGTEQGLLRLNLTTGYSERYTEKDGFPGNQIAYLCFDEEGSLWLTTKKAGLLRLKDGSLSAYSKENGLSTNKTNIIVENDGVFYIGNDDGTIDMANGMRISHLNITGPLNGMGVRDICFCRNEPGAMLVASYAGLLKYHNGKSVLMTEIDGLPSNDIRRVYQDHKNNIWLATRSGGLAKVTPNKNITVFNAKNGLGSNYILSVEGDDKGNILVGTHSAGLARINPSGQLEKFNFNTGNAGVLIFNIDVEGDIAWLSTNVGLFYFDGQTIQKIELENKFRAQTFFDFVDDTKGNVWLTSNVGILMISKQELNEFISGKKQLVTFRLFDDNDGMLDKECTAATKSLLSRDKKIWVPTLGGVVVVDPENISENPIAPKVLITKFYTDFESQHLRGNTQRHIVEPGHLRYQFDFTALSLLAPNKVHFKYKLEGVDNDWVDLTEGERSAVYTTIPPGNYVFKVIACNNDNVWNNEGATVHFKVKPFYYQTPWFYLALIILIGVTVFGAVRWRIKNIEKVNKELMKLNKELDRFVYSASHDLRAPLTSVMGLVDIAVADQRSEGKDECLHLIKGSVVKLDGFIKDIIDYSRNQRMELQLSEINIDYEVREIFEELKFLDKAQTIEKRISIQTTKYFVTDRRRLHVVLKNLIANAIIYHNHYMQEPYVEVFVEVTDKLNVIEVRDNGRGIDKEHHENIFNMFYRASEGSQGSGLGLYIVKETMDKLSGKISLQSEYTKGSTFRLELPHIPKSMVS